MKRLAALAALSLLSGCTSLVTESEGTEFETAEDRLAGYASGPFCIGVWRAGHSRFFSVRGTATRL